MIGEVILKEELESFLSTLQTLYGYDFSQYSKPSLKRRIHRIMLALQSENLEDLKNKITGKTELFDYFLSELTVNVTEMFRDPDFFKALVQQVFPALKHLDYIRIWHAGCSTGEEVYSMAILLQESGLLNRSKIYATDINSKNLSRAKQGIFPISQVKQFSINYIKSGGTNEFSKYYTASNENVIFNDVLKKQMTFAQHNLVSDQSFNEFHLILCRNVLIYFDKDLQNKVIKLFTQSLANNSFLALGSKESIRFTENYNQYKIFDKASKIWQKTDE